MGFKIGLVWTENETLEQMNKEQENISNQRTYSDLLLLGLGMSLLMVWTNVCDAAIPMYNAGFSSDGM